MLRRHRTAKGPYLVDQHDERSPYGGLAEACVLARSRHPTHTTRPHPTRAQAATASTGKETPTQILKILPLLGRCKECANCQYEVEGTQEQSFEPGGFSV